MKKLEIGTLLYPDDFPDLDKMEIMKAIYREVDRQVGEQKDGAQVAAHAPKVKDC